MGLIRKGNSLEDLAKKMVKGKNNCNSCGKVKTLYAKKVDGVTYMLCDGCKSSFD